MKKVLVSACILTCMSVGAFAEFIWDPIVIGYQNVFFESSSPVLSSEKKQTNANNFAIGALLAGIGYLPQDKGFCFMWENSLGIGKAKTQRKGNKDLYSTGMSITNMSDFIFGFAFTPIENMKLSFGSGFSLGINTLLPTGESRGNNGIVYVGAIIGLPIDVTMRYYFTNRVGVVFGLKDVIGGSIGAEITGDGFVSGFLNTFNIKVGLTTKW